MKDSRLLLIRENEKILSLLLTDGNLVEMSAFSQEAPSANLFSLGSIYVGKVKNVVKNINAAFVELAPGQNAFLPLEDLRGSCHLLNRKYDGRVLAGDELLVQVSREAVKTKDPVLTTRLSLSGRYVVVEAKRDISDPAAESGTDQKRKLYFSNKLNGAVCQKIREYLQSVWQEETSDIWSRSTIIVRTNAASLTDCSPLGQEIQELSAKLNRICTTAASRTCYSCLYRPAAQWLTEIRDTYQDQYDEIVTEDAVLFQELHAFLEASCPEELSRLRLYTDERLSLKNLYRLTTRIQEATDARVWLRSGGYLVIEPTEALTVIDVNSGKYSGKKGSSETWKLINLEAAAEIARQLRLRNLSGIIIADFINMDSRADEEELLHFLSQELKKDPVKASVIDMTPLGLVEITRKKIRRSLQEQLEK